MRVFRAKDESAYSALSFALSQWEETHRGVSETLIVDIETTILGKDRIIALYDGFGGYEFDSDWYEGGEIYLTGITPISEIGDMKYRL